MLIIILTTITNVDATLCSVEVHLTEAMVKLELQLGSGLYQKDFFCNLFKNKLFRKTYVEKNTNT
jgi:hypothetical protein